MRLCGQVTGGRGWRYADWFLRIALASVFLSAGLPKWVSLAKTAEMMQLPFIVALLVATAEVGGALLILLGGFGDTWMFDWATRVGGFAFVIVMSGAMLLVHWGQWLNRPTEAQPAGGIEFPFVLWMIGLFFTLRGNGVLGAREHG